MSIKLIVAVWDSDLPRDERAIADKFANFANDDGDGIYVGISRIAYLSKYEDRQARRITKKLVERGVLEFLGKSKFNTNLYRFHVDQLPEREPFDTAKIGRPTGKVADISNLSDNKVADISEKVADISPKVADIAESANPLINPEENPLDSAIPAEWAQESFLPEQEQSKPETEKKEGLGKQVQNERLNFIVDHFSVITKLNIPETKTKKQKAAAAVRWWNPLRKILTACDWDLSRAAHVVETVIRQMDADELTISAPQSIESNALALIGKERRQKESAGETVIDSNGAYL